MLIYLLTFSLSIIIIVFGQRCFQIKQQQPIAVLLSIIAILIPSIISGCRDLEIGTDVLAYLTIEYTNAQNSYSLQQFIQETRVEVLFATMTYIVAYYIGDIHWLLFFIQLITITLFFLTAYYYRKKAPMWITMLFFYLFLYQTSFNMLRQAIALAICLYIFRYVEQRKIWKFIIGIIIAMGFHLTAILFFVLYPLYGKYSSMSLKKLFYLQSFLIVTSIITILFYNEIMFGLILFGVLDPKYIAYTSYGDLFEPFFSYAEFILRLVILSLALYNYRYKLLGEKESAFYLFIVIFELLCTLTSLYSAFASRISLYFFMLNFIYLPQIFFKSQNKKILTSIFFAFMVYFWYFIFIKGNVSETYPYSSSILGL